MAFDLLNTLQNELLVDETNNTIEVTSQLNKKDYSKLKTLLNRLGGEWNTSAQHFQFNKCAQTLIDRAIKAGARALNTYHFYPTPPVIFNFIKAFTAVECIGCNGGSPVKVLEPSIGEGSLANELVKYGKENGINYDIQGYELDPLNALIAREQGYNVVEANFLEVEPVAEYDIVLMNPPFNGSEYIKHIKHAQKFLKPDGQLISVTPPTWITNEKRNSLEKWLLEQVKVFGVTSLMKGDFFDEDTFEAANTETLVIEIGSVDRYDTAIKKQSYQDRSLSDFSYWLDMDGDSYREIESMKDMEALPSAEDVSDFVAKALIRARKDEVHVCDSFKPIYEAFVMSLAKPSPKQVEPVNLDLFEAA